MLTIAYCLARAQALNTVAYHGGLSDREAERLLRRADEWLRAAMLLLAAERRRAA